MSRVWLVQCEKGRVRTSVECSELREANQTLSLERPQQWWKSKKEAKMAFRKKTSCSLKGELYGLKDMLPTHHTYVYACARMIHLHTHADTCHTRFVLNGSATHDHATSLCLQYSKRCKGFTYGHCLVRVRSSDVSAVLQPLLSCPLLFTLTPFMLLPHSCRARSGYSTLSGLVVSCRDLWGKNEMIPKGFPSEVLEASSHPTARGSKERRRRTISPTALFGVRLSRTLWCNGCASAPD